MLASPDASLAQRQPALPGLALVLDAQALATAARAHGLQLPDDCAPCYVRFKPGTRCLVGYGPRNFRGPPRFYASALERGSQKLVKALERRVVDTEAGPGRIVMSDAAVEVCTFPNDDHLKSLIALSDTEKRMDVTDRLLGREDARGNSELQLIAYKPERRCVFKYTLDDGTAAVIKAYEKIGFAAARARARHFCSKPGIPGAQRLLGADERRRLLAMNWLTGQSLDEVIRSESPDMCRFHRAGALISTLHDSEPDGLPEWNHRDATAHLVEVANVLAVLLPEEGSRAANLAVRVSAALSEDEAESVVLHGDFHTRQVLFEGDTAALIDFDEALIGPAAMDLGYCISRLHMDAARREISRETASSAAAALLEGYAPNHPLPPARSIRAFTALALLDVAHEPFRRHRPDWPSEISTILDEVERLLGALQ